MGRYTTSIIDANEFKSLVTTIRDGYNDGKVKHRPNRQVATILILQANLGCRIGDIVSLKIDNIVYDGEAWRLNLIEQKTGKTRPFIVPTPVKELIDNYCTENNITTGRLFDIEEPAVWKAVRQATKYLNLENVSCHSLRKMASLRIYLASDKDIALTSQFLNHSSPSVTMRYLKRSSKQMDDILSKNVDII